jgi:hypothetical protein
MLITFAQPAETPLDFSAGNFHQFHPADRNCNFFDGCPRDTSISELRSRRKSSMSPVMGNKRKTEGVTTKETMARQKRRPLRNKTRFDCDSDDHFEDDVVPKADYRGTEVPHDVPSRQSKVKVQPPSQGQESSSDNEDDDVEEDELDISADDDTDVSLNSDDSDASSRPNAKKRKRNDPDAFATSISKILGSKLSTSKRSDPVLSRSKAAATASHELAEARLDTKARHKLREDRRAALERGRVKDVLGVEQGANHAGEIDGGETVQQTEKRLRKTAQRGVVKLFNAVRASQVKAEQAAQEARDSGIIGAGRREERVTEMSKKGFLDLLNGGGNGSGPFEGGGSVKVSRLEAA